MQPLRVLSLNIWNRQGPWEHRLRLLEKGIAETNPDVIGLQEVIHRPSDPTGCQAAELALAWARQGGPLSPFVYFGPAWSYEDGDQFGNAVLSRYPIADATTFALPTRDQRCLVFARIDTPDGKLPFFVTHLSWRFEEGNLREEQVLAIAKQVKATLRDDDLPAVLVGDLNAAPDATEIRFLRGLHALEGNSTFFTDCYERAGKGPGFTFDPTTNPHAALTYEAPRRIDYVLVQGPDGRGRGMPVAAEVCFSEVVTIDGARVAPTDHYGVLAEIRMR